MTILAATPASIQYLNVLKKTFIRNQLQKPNFTDVENQRLRKIVPIENNPEFNALVVRGNPRNALARDVEFPFPPSKPRSTSYMARARAKRRYTQAEQLEYRHEKRSTLYAGMVTAGKILPSYVNKDGKIRQHSTSLCRRYMQTHENAKNYVTLSVDSNHIAKFTDLIVCDNNWLCPVCSSLHLSTMAAEISTVQKNFLAAGRDKNWSTWMLTLTIPHTRTDKLDDLLTKKSAVMSDFHAHSAIKKLKKRIGWDGYVDSLENRYGDANGWHPHNHILGFFKNMHEKTRVQCVYDRSRDYYRIATQADKKSLERKRLKLERDLEKSRSYLVLAKPGSEREKYLVDKIEKLEKTPIDEIHKIEVWQYIYKIFAYLCVKNGLKRPSERHGVDFRKSDDIQDYLTKQSKIAHELTAEHDKNSIHSRSQWEIIRDSESDDEKLASHSKSLFREFARATRGRAKIHWSPGFKAIWLSVDDEIGDGVAVDEETPSDKIYKISRELWHRFFTGADRVHQQLLLNLAEIDSFNGTSYTENYLLDLQKILDAEDALNRGCGAEENERLFDEWLVKPPAPPPKFCAA